VEGRKTMIDFDKVDLSKLERKFYVIIPGKRVVENFDEQFEAAISRMLENGEMPCDLKLPDDAKLYYSTPGRRVERVFIYKGCQIRIKPSFSDKITLTSYDSDRTIELGGRDGL
jgi:hypothetical protein